MSASGQQEGSRFTEYTPTDHQAPLWIATSITLTYAGLFLLVRLGVKYKVLGLDDAFLAVAHILGFAQWGVMYKALHHGVGKSIPNDSSQSAVSKLVFASRILTLLVVGLSKGSVVLFLRQLFMGTRNKAWHWCTALLGITTVWTVVSTLIIGVGCHPNGALLLESQAQCVGDLTRWRIVTAIDVFIEVSLVIAPAFLFYTVQISRARKLTVVGAFVPRVIVPAVFIAYLEAYVRFREHGGTSLEVTANMVWQQVLCGYSLVSATTPCLKGFLGRFRTEDLARLNDSHSGTRTYGHNSRSRTNVESFVMDSIDRRKSRKKTRGEDTTMLSLSQAEVLHSATAYAETGERGDGSVKSFGSDRMMIHRKVEYDVTSS